MSEWLYSIINTSGVSVTVLFAAFLGGLIAAFTSCCNYALIGLVAGYSGTSGVEKKYKYIIFASLFFLLGSTVSLALIGAVFGYISQVIVNNYSYLWKIVAGALSILFGLFTLNIVPVKIFSLKPKRKNYNKNFGASLIFGLVVGSFTIGCNTCCNPVFPVVFGASFIKGSYLWGIILLTVFGVGFSLPFSALMLGLGTGVAKLSNSFNKITIVIRWIAGLLLIAIGFYILLTI